MAGNRDTTLQFDEDDVDPKQPDFRQHASHTSYPPKEGRYRTYESYN